MKTTLIQITDNRAFDIVDGAAFDDNGGDPDGNAMLQEVVLVENAEAAVAAGYATIIDGSIIDDRAIGELIGGVAHDLDIDSDALDALFHLTSDALTYGRRTWSHYGAWGTIDSRWLVVAA